MLIKKISRYKVRAMNGFLPRSNQIFIGIRISITGTFIILNRLLFPLSICDAHCMPSKSSVLTARHAFGLMRIRSSQYVSYCDASWPARAFKFGNPKNSSFDVRVPVFPIYEGARIPEMMNWAGVKVLPPDQANVSYTYKKIQPFSKKKSYRN